MVNYNHYSYKITWSIEDQEFVGLCAEFPSLSYLDEDQLTALSGITALVKDVVADMESNDEKVPEPISEKNFSGKFQVRVPPDLHRKLTLRAAEENVSLNRYVSCKLAC
jgi:predicted HicB family RNase H-like nuclease